MVAFNSLKLKDVLYDSSRHRFRGWENFEVKVLEIDLEKRQALCSWNGNKPTWYTERHLKSLRRTRKE